MSESLTFLQPVIVSPECCGGVHSYDLHAGEVINCGCNYQAAISVPGVQIVLTQSAAEKLCAWLDGWLAHCSESEEGLLEAYDVIV